MLPDKFKNLCFILLKIPTFILIIQKTSMDLFDIPNRLPRSVAYCTMYIMKKN